MARKKEGGRVSKGRGTKAERRARRRAEATSGQGPVTPARTDRAMTDMRKRRGGPRRLGPHTIDAPGHHTRIVSGGAQAKVPKSPDRRRKSTGPTRP